jgi:hypothetical protein
VAQLKHEVVVTFLAILEMTRIKLIRSTQGPAEGQGPDDIFITRAVEDVRERAREVSGSTT